MSTFQPPGRRRLGRAIGVAVVILAVVAGIIALIVSQNRSDPVTQPTGTPTSPSATPTEDVEARAANGCLGGATVNAAMILEAQRQAPRDDIGAAEFTASFMRWAGVSDTTLPPLAELDPVFSAVIENVELSSELVAATQSLNASETERTGPSITGTGGGYYIESTSKDTVVVSVMMVVPEWSPSPEQVWGGSATMTLTRSSGSWLIEKWDATRTPEDMTEIMTPFVGGC